jgi:hypothetical protein
MSPTEVAVLLAELRAGRLTVGDVAERFRLRDWPAVLRLPHATHAEMAGQQDVDADVPDSLDEVTAAYDRGELTSEEYRVLCDAVADAINTAPRQDS